MTTSTQEWTEDIKIHDKNIIGMIEAHQTQLSTLDDVVTNYVTKELEQDLPTGMSFCPSSTCVSNCLSIYVSLGTTPQRKQFTYPRILSHTRPHLELIKEYETHNEVEDSGSEEEEPVSHDFNPIPIP